MARHRHPNVMFAFRRFHQSAYAGDSKSAVEDFVENGNTKRERGEEFVFTIDSTRCKMDLRVLTLLLS
uniref:Uncharacterized protein n=1 Tax=Oryza barthii TaxID=65489 RepID=A0A0D3HTU9_9ORYZ